MEERDEGKPVIDITEVGIDEWYRDNDGLGSWMEPNFWNQMWRWSGNDSAYEEKSIGD